MERIDRSFIRKIRCAVQWIIFFLVVHAGWRFVLFVREIERGAVPAVNRPPSVEGFLPIGSFMALKLWITEGVFDPVHPAGIVLFSGAMLLAVFLKKSFCGWVCPVGTLSDAVWKAGKKIFGKNFVLPKFLDYPLRSLKYLLMAFFLYVILIQMSSSDIVAFLSTPYWKISDIKLLRFFADMSATTQITLGTLFFLSLLYKNFWCRYLCPYGGLLGLLSFLSPVKIRRDKDACIKCGLCSKNCPSLLPVDRKETVRSPECTGCLTCVSHCPARGALDAAVSGRRPIAPGVYVAALIAIYFGLILLAKLTGRWESSLTPQELLNLISSIDTFGHP